MSGLSALEFRTIEDLQAGEHACCCFENDQERDASVVAWIRMGLRRGERLLCVLDTRPASELIALLEEVNLPVGPAIASGQLEIDSADRTYLLGGSFDPDAMIQRLERAAQDAVAQGYPALRVIAEMSWVLRSQTVTAQLLEYEARVAEVFDRRALLGLCLYDQRRFASEDLLEQLRCHALVVIGDQVHASPFWAPTSHRGQQRDGHLPLQHWHTHMRVLGGLVRSLQASERRYRQLFEGLVSGFALHEMIFDDQGRPVDYRFLEVNAAFAELTGLPAEEVLGRRVLEVLPDLDPEWVERYGRVVRTGQTSRFRMFSTPLQRHYEVAAYRTDPGQFATLFSDITEIVLGEERRIEAERRLFESQKLDSLGLLAGGIAHDFNNMLMGVLGNASMALDEVPRGSFLDECLQDVEIAAKNAAGLAKQLLAYSGRGRFVVEPVDLAAVVIEMTKLLEASIPKSVRIRFQLEPDVGAVQADVSQLRQVLMNLILNASQAIGERSGVITVALSCMDCDAAYLDTTFAGEGLVEGHYVYLEVSDTGVGMDAETLQRIFDPFFSTKEQGRGLGLAAALGIIRGHKGAIKVYSEPDRGTTFKVLLPRCGDSVVPAVSKPPGEQAFLASGTVLVVDDEEPVRRVAARILRTLGFDVLVAEDGREAVAIYSARKDEIVLVLLDMMMPRMGGERTFTELRRIEPEVRVVLTSGYNEQDAVVSFVGRGLAGFIQKPYPKSELERVVREALE